MKDKILLTLILISSLSCSLILSETNEMRTKELVLLNKKEQIRFCEKQATLEIIGPSEENNKSFLSFLKKTNGTLEEKFALWVLLNAKLRPDKFSSRSQIRFLKILNNSLAFKEFNTEDSLSNFLKTITPKIETLSTFLNKNYNSPLLVDEEFEFFLERNKNEIWKRNELREIFFKDEQTLKKGESLSDSKSLFLSLKNTKPEVLSSLKSPMCDFDLSIYEGLPQKILPISPEEQKPLLIGLSTRDEHYLAIIDQNIDWNSPSVAENIFNAKILPPISGAPFCLFSKDESNVLFIARETRDPRQLLKTISEKVSSFDYTKKSLSTLLDAPRRMVLQHPTRILIELEDEKKDPLKYSKKFPLYPVPHLGKIDALLFSSKKEQGFIIDKRGKEALGCLKDPSRL